MVKIRPQHSLTVLMFLAGLTAVARCAWGEDVNLLMRRKDWISTGADNALKPEKGLFRLIGSGQRRRLFTDSEETNIHAHYRGAGVARLKNYIYTGRMRIMDAGGGVGVTFYSRYPRADVYYRLRMYGGGSFHIEPHPDGEYVLEGVLDSGVVPQAGIWQRFKVSVRSFRRRAVIRARVWPEGAAEQKRWQIDCVDKGLGRLRQGRPGVWSMGAGVKEWRDLAVKTAAQ